MSLSNGSPKEKDVGGETSGDAGVDAGVNVIGKSSVNDNNSVCQLLTMEGTLGVKNSN